MKSAEDISAEDVAGVRILFYSDTHLGFEFPANPRSKHKHRGNDFFENFHRVYQYALDNDIRYVIHGGDLFYRSRIPLRLVNYVYAILLEYAEQGIDTYIVPGNHERSRLPQSLLIHHKRIHVFDAPKTFHIDFEGMSLSLSGFPFIRENIRGQFLGLLDQAGWFKSQADKKVLCVHQAIQGAQVGPHNYTFNHGMDVIPMRLLPADATAVLCGHIHRRQVLYSGTGVPVIHAGSIERTSFAECNEPKGFYDLTFFKDKPVPATQLVKLPARPMYEMLVGNHSNHSQILDKIEHLAGNLPENAVVRFRAGINLSLSDIRAVVPETMSVYYLYEEKGQNTV